MSGKRKSKKALPKQTVASFLPLALRNPLKSAQKPYLEKITFDDLNTIGAQLDQLRTQDTEKFDSAIDKLGLPGCYCWP